MLDKFCTSCNQYVDREDFHKGLSNFDGLQRKCKSCTNKANKKYYKGNRAMVLERNTANRNKRKGGTLELYEEDFSWGV